MTLGEVKQQREEKKSAVNKSKGGINGRANDGTNMDGVEEVKVLPNDKIVNLVQKNPTIEIEKLENEAKEIAEVSAVVRKSQREPRSS